LHANLNLAREKRGKEMETSASSPAAMTLPTGYDVNLTEQQRKCLTELKEKLEKTEYWADYQRDPDKERFLLAFLRATMKDKSGERIFQVDACMERLITTFKWRRQYNIDQLRENIENDGPKPNKFEEFRQYYVCLDVINPEHGRYVRFNRFGRFISTIDPSVLTTEEWVQNLAYDTMIIQHQLRKLSAKLGREISTYVSISDASGISLIGVANRLSFIKLMSGVAADNYPECLGQTFIINCPWLFPKIFGIVKPFLDADTLSKFVLSTHCPSDTFKTYIPAKTFPKEYGGDGEVVLATSILDLKGKEDQK
jgi:hypothetical protein